MSLADKLEFVKSKLRRVVGQFDGVAASLPRQWRRKAAATSRRVYPSADGPNGGVPIRSGQVPPPLRQIGPRPGEAVVSQFECGATLGQPKPGHPP